MDNILKFKKQLISFDEEAYNYAVSRLNKLIEVINSITDNLNKLNVSLTVDDVKLIAENVQEYKNKQYLRILKDICTMFAQNFDKVSKASYVWENPMFSDMANNKAKPLYNMAKEIYLTCHDVRHIVNYIEIKDNIATPTLSAFEDIKELYCRYTENERQNKILYLLNGMKDNIKELENMGINKYYIPQLYYTDYSINNNLVKGL